MPVLMIQFDSDLKVKDNLLTVVSNDVIGFKNGKLRRVSSTVGVRKFR